MEHEEGEKGDEEKEPIPSCLIWKEALTALSIPDYATGCTDVDDNVVKAMEECSNLFPRYTRII
jgi:hypothetical protein